MLHHCLAYGPCSNPFVSLAFASPQTRPIRQPSSYSYPVRVHLVCHTFPVVVPIEKLVRHYIARCIWIDPQHRPPFSFATKQTTLTTHHRIRLDPFPNTNYLFSLYNGPENHTDLALKVFLSGLTTQASCLCSARNPLCVPLHDSKCASFAIC